MDDDKEINFMTDKIIEIFGVKGIIVLVPRAGFEDSDSENDSSSDREASSIKMKGLTCLSYNLFRKQDAFNHVRSILQDKLNSGIGLVLSSS